MAAGRGPAATRRPPGSLRTALGGLTTRGRSFLAAGIAATVCSLVLGQRELLRVGLLLGVLPLLCALVLHTTRHQVTAARQLAPAQVAVGVPSRVRLRVVNVARLRSGLLLLHDRVPHVLGPRPRFVLDRMAPGEHREVSYQVRSELRGRYPLGPLYLRLADPFGMCELTRSCDATDVLTVLPPVRVLPPIRLGGGSSGNGDGQPGALALAGDDDVIPRAYRHGDDLRRVHWRSTARRGELMVRREEQPWRDRCTVLLDTRRGAYRGAGPGSPFEWAVSGAASVAQHLLARGYAVNLVTDRGSAVPGPDAGLDGGAVDTAGVLLDALAGVTHSNERSLSRAVAALTHGPTRPGLLVAFLGDLEPEHAEDLARLRHHASTALAFAVHDGGFLPGPRRRADDGHDAPPSPGERVPLRLLREAGWAAVAAQPRADLADLWRAVAAGGTAPPASGGTEVPRPPGGDRRAPSSQATGTGAEDAGGPPGGTRREDRGG